MNPSPCREPATRPATAPLGARLALGLSLAFLCASAAQGSERETRAALVGHEAPDFTLRALAGGNVRLSDARGEVVLIGFWTSWCGTCRATLERLQRLHSTYASAGLVVVGVSLDDDPAKAGELVAGVHASYRNGFDAAKSTGPSFHISGVPVLVLIDRAGVVRFVHGDLPRREEADLTEEIRRLLDE
jgi:thiol-disulfide isomerase/thioredoxin